MQRKIIEIDELSEEYRWQRVQNYMAQTSITGVYVMVVLSVPTRWSVLIPESRYILRFTAKKKCFYLKV